MTIKLSKYVARAAGLLTGGWPSLRVTSHAGSVLVEGAPLQIDQLSRHIWSVAHSSGLSGKQVHVLQTVALQMMEQVIEARSPRGVLWEPAGPEVGA